ncbi:MAG: hypothetical protein Kow0042_23850 [Calditrichia bacterium]
MKRWFVFTAILIALLCAGLWAQESEQKEMEIPTAPPQPLNDEWSNWLVGEWKGISQSNMGKSEEWMKIEKGLDGQFLIMHYKSKVIEANPEAMKKMQEQMKMSAEDMEKMMQSEYRGMGLSTINPMTGEMVGYWFDNYRDVSKGTGKMEGNKSTAKWKSAFMEMERIVEKIDENKMKVTYSGKDAMGTEFSGTSELSRVK